jgi:hypothetical protein
MTKEEEEKTIVVITIATTLMIMEGDVSNFVKQFVVQIFLIVNREGSMEEKNDCLNVVSSSGPMEDFFKKEGTLSWVW